MKLKVDEYIQIDNYKEWIEIQKYLFRKEYKWCNDTQDVILTANYPFPDYILIEINYKNKNDNLMFSYAHIPYHNSIIHKASKLLKQVRKEKLINLNEINKI